jgi:LPXTG-motif cell wall-anchored protein
MRLKSVGGIGPTTALIGCAWLLGGQAMAQTPSKRGPSSHAAPATQVTPPSLSDSLTGMAKAEYEAGKILYRDNDFANALVKFQHAHELGSDPRLLWNLAACEKNLRRYSRARALLQRFGMESDTRVTAEDRRAAADLEKVLAPFISALKVVVSEPGADVLVDDEKIGTSPLAGSAHIDVGKHIFRVRKPGFKEFAETRQVDGGSEVVVVASLEKEVHQGRLIIEAGPKDLISLDGKVVGQRRWEGPISSGGHELRVSAAGMTTHRSEVVVQDDKTRRIPIRLDPLPKTGESNAWLWVAGGAVLVAGAVVGGVFLLKPSEVPSVQGTLGTFPLSFGGRR